MELRPLGQRVIVSIVEEQPFSYNGIIIPVTVKGNLKRGKILAIGNKVGSDLKVEDMILFTENSGEQIDIKNENYLILNEQEILAIYK